MRVGFKNKEFPMNVLLSPSSKFATLADLLDDLGNMPLTRIRFHPPLGTATERDVLTVHAQEKRLCELVDGVLVEKVTGFQESCLALALGALLQGFVKPRKLGLVVGPDGTIQLSAGLIRIPDVAFYSWDRIPGRHMPKEPIPKLVPNLAVEVLSASNTAAEMTRKRRDYFEAGVCLVWLIDPVARTVAVYTAPDRSTVLNESETLDGGDILPGFALPLRDLFAELDQDGNPA